MKQRKHEPHRPTAPGETCPPREGEDHLSCPGASHPPLPEREPLPFSAPLTYPRGRTGTPGDPIDPPVDDPPAPNRAATGC